MRVSSNLPKPEIVHKRVNGVYKMFLRKPEELGEVVREAHQSWAAQKDDRKYYFKSCKEAEKFLVGEWGEDLKSLSESMFDSVDLNLETFKYTKDRKIYKIFLMRPVLLGTCQKKGHQEWRTPEGYSFKSRREVQKHLLGKWNSDINEVVMV